MLLSELITTYLNHITGSHSPDTILNKQSDFKKLLLDIGDKPIDQITTEALEQFRRDLLETHKRSSIKTIFNHVRALLSYAVKLGVLTQNSCDFMIKLRVAEPLNPDSLERDELKRLFDLIDRQPPIMRNRDRLMMTLALNAGLRRLELANLKWSDVDLAQGVIYIREGKGLKSRIVPINETLRKVLEGAYKTCEWVVTNRSGGQVSRPALTASMGKYLNKLNHNYKGKTRLTLHSLRASFLTSMAMKNVSPYVIQRLAGHSNLSTTLHYVKIGVQDMRDAVSKLG